MFKYLVFKGFVCVSSCSPEQVIHTSIAMDVAVQVTYPPVFFCKSPQQIPQCSDTPECAARTSGEEGLWYLKESELLVRMEAWRSEATVRHTLYFHLK